MDHSGLVRRMQTGVPTRTPVSAGGSFSRDGSELDDAAVLRAANALAAETVSDEADKVLKKRLDASSRRREKGPAPNSIVAGKARGSTGHDGGGAGRKLDVVAPEWMSRTVGWLTDPGTGANNKPVKRIGNALKGAWNQYAGSLGYVPLAIVLNSVENAEKQGEMRRERTEAQIERLRTEREGLIRQSGADAQDVDRIDRQITRWQRRLENGLARQAELDKRRKNVLEDVDTWIRRPSRRLIEAGNAQVLEAERGLGTVGQLITEAGVAGVQMLLDAAAGGENVMAPMLVRSFGMGARRAEADGADPREMMLQGMKSAAIEYATERIFAGNPLYDRAHGQVTGWVRDYLDGKYGRQAMDRIYQSMAGRAARLPGSMAGESLEEVAADYLDPLINHLFNGLDGGERDTSLPDQGSVKRDAYIGALLSLFGSAVTTYRQDAVQTDPGLDEWTEADADGILGQGENTTADDVVPEPENGILPEGWRPPLELVISDKQIGKKVGKHAADFDLDAADASGRRKFYEITADIFKDYDEIRIGTWRSQNGHVLFYIKGQDVAVMDLQGNYITTLKGGIKNARVKDAGRIEV